MTKLLNYFKGDDLAANVWRNKYKYKEADEKLPSDMHWRMSREFVRENKKYPQPDKSFISKLSPYGQQRTELTEQKVFGYFDKFKYIVPQGSNMENLGTSKIASLSNCWVVDEPLDSYTSILKTDGELVFLYKRRGGVGTGLSGLRPKDTTTKNAARTTSGAVSFAHRYSNTTREVAQSGRRGALLLTMDVRHPDILEFIKVKQDQTSVTGANISIKLNKEFIDAVENDEDFFLRFPITHPVRIGWNVIAKEYNKMYHTPQDGNVYFKKIRAKELWDELIRAATHFAEPGLMYWDNTLNYDPAAVYENYKPTNANPCGEVYLQPYDSCRLIAVNLFSFVIRPFTEKAKINFDKLYEVFYEATVLGDNLVGLEIKHIQRIINKIKSDPEPDDIKQSELELWMKAISTVGEGRRMGTGITALGDMLAALNIPYNSEEALVITNAVMKEKMRAELDALIDMAITRGTFEGYDKNKEFEFDEKGNPIKGKNNFYDTLLKEYPEQVERMVKYGRRSVNWSTISPTGSVSILTQTTSGIEPLFAPYYTRRKKVSDDEPYTYIDNIGDKWQEFFVLHPKFKEWINITQDSVNLDTINEETLKQLFKQSPWYNNTANDIDYMRRVDMQSVLQKFTSNAISSTINLPKGTKEDVVSKIYLYAHKKGLKGVTVYVDGSRSGVLINEKETVNNLEDNHATKRPKSLKTIVIPFRNYREKWIALIGMLNNRPYEIFTFKKEDFPNYTHGIIQKVKENGIKRYDFIYNDYTLKDIGRLNNDTQYSNIQRLISGILRHKMPINKLIELIDVLNLDDAYLGTWKNGVVRAFKKFIKKNNSGDTCPICNEKLVFEEGCLNCKNCGYSKCG